MYVLIKGTRPHVGKRAILKVKGHCCFWEILTFKLEENFAASYRITKIVENFTDEKNISLLGNFVLIRPARAPSPKMTYILTCMYKDVEPTAHR